MVCGNFILPEPASYVFFYAFSNLRNLLYIIKSEAPLPRGEAKLEKFPLFLFEGMSPTKNNKSSAAKFRQFRYTASFRKQIQ